jgi:hypothetical protein
MSNDALKAVGVVPDYPDVNYYAKAERKGTFVWETNQRGQGRCGTIPPIWTSQK